MKDERLKVKSGVENKKVPNLSVSGLGFLHPVSSRDRF